MKDPDLALPKPSAECRAKLKAERRKAVREYAAEMSGTRFDLDLDWEAAAIEELLRMDLQK